MSAISDEMLMAYADGELGREERALVESYLRSHPEGQARLEVFAHTGRDLGGLFDEIFRSDVPQALVDFVRAPAAPGNVIDFHDRRQWRLESRAPTRPAFGRALAASLAAVALFAGAVALNALRNPGQDETLSTAISEADGRVASPALALVLDETPSGKVADAVSGGAVVKVKPVFTFANAAGGFCRQYLVESGVSRLGGVACREAGAAWTVKAQVPLGAAKPQSDKIVPAGHDDAPEIEALVDRLISGDVLGVEDEKALISGGWTKPAP